MGTGCSGQKPKKDSSGVSYNQFSPSQNPITQGELKFNMQLTNIKVKIAEIVN